MLVLLELPDELQACCACFLDTLSAARLAAASRACERLVLAQLVAAKAAHQAAALAALVAAEAAQAQPRRRIAFCGPGKAFIDAHVDEFIVASPIERKYLVQRILFAAREELGFAAAGWTVLSIFSRLKNTRSLRNV
jgi:hypothetical protein